MLLIWQQTKQTFPSKKSMSLKQSNLHGLNYGKINFNSLIDKYLYHNFFK